MNKKLIFFFFWVAIKNQRTCLKPPLRIHIPDELVQLLAVKNSVQPQLNKIPRNTISSRIFFVH